MADERKRIDDEALQQVNGGFGGDDMLPRSADEAEKLREYLEEQMKTEEQTNGKSQSGHGGR